MKKQLTEMTNQELRQYLSKNRHNEEAFSQALEILMSRKTDPFKYPPPSEMNYQDIETIFQNKINNE